jgi:hypothetical protein
VKFTDRDDHALPQRLAVRPEHHLLEDAVDPTSATPLTERASGDYDAKREHSSSGRRARGGIR